MRHNNYFNSNKIPKLCLLFVAIAAGLNVTALAIGLFIFYITAFVVVLCKEANDELTEDGSRDFDS